MHVYKDCAKWTAGETEDGITEETYTAVALHRDRWINRKSHRVGESPGRGDTELTVKEKLTALFFGFFFQKLDTLDG